MKVRRLRLLQMNFGRPRKHLKGGGVAEVSCAFLLGVIAWPYAWQTMRCARRRARVAETWGKRDCAQAVRVSPFRSKAYRDMRGLGTLCRDLCAGQPGTPSPRPLQFDSGVSVATGSLRLFSAVLGSVCVGSCTSACTSATSQASVVFLPVVIILPVVPGWFVFIHIIPIIMPLPVNYISSLNYAHFYFISFIPIRSTIPVALSFVPIVLVPFTGICRIGLNFPHLTPKSALSALCTPARGVPGATSFGLALATSFSLDLSICGTVPLVASFVGTPFFSFRGALFAVYVGPRGRLSALAALLTALGCFPIWGITPVTVGRALRPETGIVWAICLVLWQLLDGIHHQILGLHGCLPLQILLQGFSISKVYIHSTAVIVVPLLVAFPFRREINKSRCQGVGTLIMT